MLSACKVHILTVCFFALYATQVSAHAFPRIITIDDNGIRPLSIELDDDTSIVIENTTTKPTQVVFGPSLGGNNSPKIHSVEIAPGDEWLPDITTDTRFTYYLQNDPHKKGVVFIERFEKPIPDEMPWHVRIWSWLQSLW